MSCRPTRMSRLATRLLVITVVSGLVGAGLLADRPATAQVDGDTYTNPTYRYQLQWDADIWSVPDDGTGDLTLESDQVQFYLQSGQFYSGDATACRDDLVARLPDDPTVLASEPFDGDGDVDGESEGRAFATLQVELDATDSEDARTVVERIDCRTVVAGEAVLAITWIAPVDGFDDAAALTDDLLGNLVIPSFQAPGSTPTGVAAGTYTDPDYGFGLEWDESDWFAFAPVDAIFGLNDETSLISFDLPADFGNDAATCVEGTLDDLGSSPGVVDASPIEVDGEAVAGLDDAGWSYAAVDIDYGGAEQFVEVRCAAIPGEDVTLRAVHSGPIASYEAEAERASPVFASLTLPDGSEPNATGAPATPTGVEPAATPSAAMPSDAPGTPEVAEPATTPRATPGEPATFTSEEGGWSISYDAAIWAPLDPAIYATVDLAISADASVVTIDTVTTKGAEPRDILAGIIDSEVTQPAADSSGAEQLDDPPLGATDGAVGAAYAYPDATGGDRAEAVVVIPLDGETAVVVRVYTTPAGYADGLVALGDLLNGFAN